MLLYCVHLSGYLCSVQCYGKRSLGGWMYPGSGATCDTRTPSANPAAPDTAPANGDSQLPSAPAQDGFGEVPPEDPELEFATAEGEHPLPGGPRVINVGIAGPGNEDTKFLSILFNVTSICINWFLTAFIMESWRKTIKVRRWKI